MNIFQRAIHAAINSAKKGHASALRVHELAPRTARRKRNSYRMARSGGPVLTGERLRKTRSSCSPYNLTIMPKHLSADEKVMASLYRAARRMVPEGPANTTVKKGAA